MEEYLAHWIEFGAILVATGAIILFLFFCVLGIRWHYREKRMNVILDSLKDPYMVTQVRETKTTLDCRVGEFTQVAFT